MKVILADDVRGLGHRGDTVTVKPGYARNFLFPQSLAYEATAANVRKLGEEKKKYDEKMLTEKAGAETSAGALIDVLFTPGLDGHQIGFLGCKGLVDLGDHPVGELLPNNVDTAAGG